MGDIDIGAMGCKAQFSTGLYGVVTEVYGRRFPVIDEERQAVFAFGVFDQVEAVGTSVPYHSNPGWRR